MSPLRLLLVEDDSWVRDALGALARSEPDFTLAASCPSGLEALKQVEAGLDFDLGVIDLGLPGIDGVETIRRLRRLRPDATLLAFTVFEDAPTVMAAIRAGARGYLLKRTPFDRLALAIREAHAGGAPMSPSVARLVVEELAREGAAAEIDAEAVRRLSPREEEVLSLLARGVTYAEAAAALDIRLGTLQGYVKNIYQKLEIGSKAEAAALAVRRGLA